MGIVHTAGSKMLSWSAVLPTAGVSSLKQSLKARQKKLKLLDINSEQELAEPPQGTAEDSFLLPAVKRSCIL